MKDQFVIAYLADFSMAESVLSHAAELARMLNKGLILLYVEDPRHKLLTVGEAEPRLIQLESTLPALNPAHAALKGDTRQIINALPTLLNGVVVVAGVNPRAPLHSLTAPRRVLRNFAQCKIAYLTVQQPLAAPYTDVAYSIDFHKESKEKLIWASYFARFNRSQLHMLHFQYTDPGLRNKWHNNVLFMDKFFASLNITYTPQPVEGRSLFPETIVCAAAAQAGHSLLISVTTDTRSRDVIEWFVGAAEDRIIRNPNRLPVLFINPRNDIYVLCD